MDKILEKYQTRTEQFAQKANELNSRYARLSLVRLLTFVAATAIIILLFSSVHILAGILGIVLFLLGFSRFISWHSQIKREADLCQNIKEINEREIACLNRDFSAFDDGKQYRNPEHPYAVDLDIFGKYSFFQFTNRTASAVGHLRLADYLRYPVALDEVRLRQDAIRELKDKLEWRQEFQAVGLATEDDISHIKELEKWLEEQAYISNNRMWSILMFCAPVFTLAALILWLTVLPWYFAILFFLPAGYAIKQTVEQINFTHTQTNKADKILRAYGEMIKRLEGQDFQSSKLTALSQCFLIEKQKASEQIERLSYIIGQLNLRYNFFAIFFNVFFLRDLRQVRNLEKWRARNKKLLPQWFDALAEFEALNSLATSYYNNPDWIFPDLNKAALVQAKELGHPLIAPKTRVCNDVEIPTRGHLKLITGSNMAGKSTFMRTVGLNIVLAQIGAPVCAKTMTLPPLKVYTSMRTEDALHESTSSFYAELKRLKFIIEAVENGDNIFFLLDEILKGTNSRDRHTGSKALIKQLIEGKGCGLIATHDLELGVLEKEYGGAIENLRIEVQIEDGQLHFDYKIKKGVSESFNASILMKQMGIDIK